MAGKMLEFMFKFDVAMSNGFSQPMRALTGQMGKLSGMSKGLQESYGKIDAFRHMSEQVKVSGTRLESLRGNLRDNAAELQRMRGRTETLSGQYESAKRRVADWSKTMPKNSTQLMFAKKRADELRREYQSSAKATQQLEREQAKLYRAVGTAEQKFAGETSQLAAMKQALNEAGISTDKLAEHQQELESALKRTASAREKIAAFREQFTWGNIKGDILSSMAAIEAFRKPVKIAMDFDQAMADTRAVFNPTKEEFAALESQAMDLGSTTQFTATQAAAAQQILARAGYDAQKVIQTMPALLSMSAAEGLELAQAADIIVSTLGGFQSGTEYANILTDLYAYTSAHANTNIAELGEAMQKAAPVAQGLDIQPEKVFAMLAGMTSAARGSEAGTALASSLQRMYAPTKAIKDIYKQLGVAYQTKSGRIVQPDILLREIVAKTANLGEAKQIELLSPVFGKMHASKMMALMTNIQSGEFTKMYGGLISERDGASAEMVKLRTDTLKGDVTSLGSAWEGTQIRIGKALDGINRTAVQKITGVIQTVNEWSDRHKPVTDTLTQGAYIAGGGLVAGKVAKYAGLGTKALGAWLDLKAAADTGGALSAVGGHMAGIFSSLGGILTGLSKFAGLIGLISFGVYEVVTHWKEITEWINRAGEALQSFDTSKIAPARMGTLSRDDSNYGEAVMYSTYQPPEIKPHAKGGILTRPHLGLVAEAGPEAIIPLRDKQRGLQVLSQAMEILGVKVPEATPVSAITESLTQSREEYSNARNYYGGNTANNSTVITNGINGANHTRQVPAVNMTVNIMGNAEDTGITERIRQAVMEALSEWQSYQERVAYA